MLFQPEWNAEFHLYFRPKWSYFMQTFSFFIFAGNASYLFPWTPFSARSSCAKPQRDGFAWSNKAVDEIEKREMKQVGELAHNIWQKGAFWIGQRSSFTSVSLAPASCSCSCVCSGFISIQSILGNFASKSFGIDRVRIFIGISDGRNILISRWRIFSFVCGWCCFQFLLPHCSQTIQLDGLQILWQITIFRSQQHFWPQWFQNHDTFFQPKIKYFLWREKGMQNVHYLWQRRPPKNAAVDQEISYRTMNIMLQ